MTLTPATGCTIGYSAALPAVYDRTGFELLNWSDIALVESIPSVGTQRATNTFTPLVDGHTRHYRTTRDHPELAVRVAFSSDAALGAMRTARQASTRYAFRVRFGDAPSGGTPSTRCFAALVTGVSEEPGGADGLIMATITLRPQPDSYVEIPRDADGVLQPTLELDFTAMARRINPRITFTRASTATYYDAQGVLRTAAANEMRFDHDPATGGALGFLAEEQRTNLLPYSEDFGEWNTVNSPVLSSSSETTPAGGQSATEITSSINDQWGRLEHQVATSIGNSYTVSAFVHAGTQTGSALSVHNGGGSNYQDARFDLDAGTVAGTNGGASGTIQAIGGGWYHCTMTWTADISNSIIAIAPWNGDLSAPKAPADDGDSVIIWGAQAEAGAFATSLIHTAGAQATRAADNAVIDGAAFAEWYRQDEGTFFAEAQTFDFSQNYRIVALDGTVAPISIVNNTLNLNFYDVTGLQFTAAGLAVNTMFRAAAAYDIAAGRAATVNGETVQTTSAIDAPSFTGATTLRLGPETSGANSLNGHIRRVAYYARRLTNAELQTITEL